MSEKLLITGCGRSGTGFVSKVLTDLGLPCGHERVFRHSGFKGWGQHRADSSWLAVGSTLGALSDVRIVHLTRNPVECARSHLGIGYFRLPPRRDREKSHRMIRRVAPAVLDQATELERFTAFWVEWNRRASAFAHESVAVERAGVSFFRQLVRRFGIEAKPETIKRVLAKRRGYNARERDNSVTWTDLAATPYGGRLTVLARQLGYEPESGELQQTGTP